MLFRSLDTSALFSHLTGVSLQYFVVAFGLQLLMRALTAWQLQRLLRTSLVSLQFYPLFAINLITAFYGLVLPGEVASGGIAWNKLRRAGSAGSTALLAIVVTRLVNLTALIVLGTIFWLGDGQIQEYQIGVFLLLMLMAFYGGYRFLTIKNHRLSTFAPLPQKVQALWRRFVEILERLNSLPDSSKTGLFLLSITIHLVGIASHVVFAKAVELNLSLWTIGWIRSAALVLGLLPLSLAGFGLREASLIYLLYSHGATMEQAVTYSILVLSVTLATGLLGAAHEMIDMWHSFSGEKKTREI